MAAVVIVAEREFARGSVATDGMVGLRRARMGLCERVWTHKAIDARGEGRKSAQYG